MYLEPDPAEELNCYEVPRRELKANGCFTILSVKRTAHEDLCDSAVRNLKRDLAMHLYENGTDVPPTTENHITGNWVALAIPNCIPSRLGVLTRFVSLMFLYDDAYAALASAQNTNKALNKQFTSGLEEALPTLDGTHQTPPCHVKPTSRSSRRRKDIESIIHPIVKELLSKDQSMGLEVLESWRSQYNSHTSAPSAGTVNATVLDDHIHNCLQTFPADSWSTTLRYALGLHLDQAELTLLAPVLESVAQITILTRDYWAWPKNAQNPDNNKRLTNSVAVSMAERHCSAAEALEAVKSAALAAESEFVKRKNAVVRVVGQGESEVVVFLEALEQFAAGSSLWCSTCPRLRTRS
ncbi:hypothetical protein Q7P37_007451 [Cladosporium fusiforme]